MATSYAGLEDRTSEELSFPIIASILELSNVKRLLVFTRTKAMGFAIQGASWHKWFLDELLWSISKCHFAWQRPPFCTYNHIRGRICAYDKIGWRTTINTVFLQWISPSSLFFYHCHCWSGCFATCNCPTKLWDPEPPTNHSRCWPCIEWKFLLNFNDRNLTSHARSGNSTVT